MTTRPLEDAEIQKLFDCISSRHAVRNRAMLLLGIAAALRATELVSLTVADVYDGHEIRTYITIRGETAKLGKQRILRLGTDVRKEISSFIRWKKENRQSLEPTKPLFVSQKGGPLSRQMLYASLRQIMERAGVDQSPHALRKTGAMIYYQQSGYDIEATREHSGHSDLSTTRKYLGLEMEKIIEYSERTARHLRSAISQGGSGKFDSPLHMSNYTLSTAPTQALLAELKERGFDVDSFAEQSKKPKKQMAQVIPISVLLRRGK